MKIENAISNRFLQFVKAMAANENSFAEKLGLDRADSIYKITKYGSSPGPKTLDRVLKTFPNLNTDWLYTGNGEMLTDTGHTAAQKSIRKPKTETKEEVIPVFDRVVAQQGTMIESLIPTTETNKSGLVKKEMFKNAQFVIRAAGNSMLPNYPSDAWIGIRRIEAKHMNPGSVYALDIGSDLILKRVYYRDDDQYSGFIQCLSDNNMLDDNGARKGKLKYPPYEIDMRDIRGIYKVTDVYKPNEITVMQ